MHIKGQAILLVIFSLILSMISLLFVLSPIRDKLLRLKSIENIYSAIYNSNKGLESVLLYKFKNINLNLRISQTSFNTNNCGGMNFRGLSGKCTISVFTPNTDRFWNPEDNFIVIVYDFIINVNGEIYYFTKLLSDGIRSRATRTFFIQPYIQ